MIITDENVKEILRLASSTLNNAYAPYSKYQVGASLISDNGKIYSGCNVENSSYGLTTCAEQNCISAMIANGNRKIYALAIVSSGPQQPYPCGRCRQIISEFAAVDCKIYIATIENHLNAKEYTIKELLPHSFTL